MNEELRKVINDAYNQSKTHASTFQHGYIKHDKNRLIESYDKSLCLYDYADIILRCENEKI